MLPFYLSRRDWGGCWLVVTGGTLTQQTCVPDKNSRKHREGEDENQPSTEGSFRTQSFPSASKSVGVKLVSRIKWSDWQTLQGLSCPLCSTGSFPGWVTQGIAVAGTSALLIRSTSSAPFLIYSSFLKKKVLGATGCQEVSVSYGRVLWDSSRWLLGSGRGQKQDPCKLSCSAQPAAAAVLIMLLFSSLPPAWPRLHHHPFSGLWIMWSLAGAGEQQGDAHSCLALHRMPWGWEGRGDGGGRQGGMQSPPRDAHMEDGAWSRHRAGSSLQSTKGGW